MKQLLKVFFALNALCLLLCPLASAQDNLPLLITAGTTIESAGSNWNYLVWQANDPQLLMDKVMGVFRKDGSASSASPFALVGTAGVETDPYVIESLIQRSVQLGEDENLLSQTITELFEDYIPSETIALSTKLSAVIQGALADEDLFDNLVFLGKRHPAINLALGLGFTDSTDNGVFTYEIRDFDAGSNAYDQVIGRVTVTTGSPTVLPAPVDVIEIVDESPMGDRNVRLRWRSPDALLRLSMLQFGFNIFRITAQNAIDRGFNLTPPTVEQLQNSIFTQVNPVPVLPDEDDANRRWFFIDDNDRFDANGVPLKNGANYYYFITARDLLGRNGQSSAGVLVTVCSRIPPMVPRDVKTRSDTLYTNGMKKLRFDLSWKPNESTNDDVTAGYYVYRGTNFVELQRDATNPALHLISSMIPHATNVARIHFSDTNFTDASIGETYWYGIRAVDDGACGANYSGLSAPAFAAVHDFAAAPEPSDSGIIYITENLTVRYEDQQEVEAPVTGESYFEVSCSRNSDQISWVEFFWSPYTLDNPDAATPMGGRYYFSDGQSAVSVRLPTRETAVFYCRAGSRSGTVSNRDHIQVNGPQKGHVRLVRFKAELLFEEVYTRDEPGPYIHYTPDEELGVPGFHWPQLQFGIPPGVAEWRLYRSVDGHRPYDLIIQGLNTNNLTEIIEEDKGAGIVYGATLCYYLQFFDENGNPGPIELIECIDVQGRDLPKPMLVDLSAAGTVASPDMKIEWFCPPVAVEYFLVGVHADDEDAMFDLALDGCQRVDYTNDYPVILEDGTTNYMDFAIFKTGRIGTRLGSETNPLFDVTASIQLGKTYSVFIRGVGVGGKESPDSNGMSFMWSHPEGAGPEVPWPVRPPVLIQSETYSTNLYPIYLDKDVISSIGYDRVGINIGQFNGFVNGKPPNYTIPAALDIMSAVYTNEAASSNTMFPFVLYRYQITNDLYNYVSGDVYQVTPFMESIASITVSNTTSVFDPYIFLVQLPGQESQYNVVLLDHQPVQRGAAYRYVMVRMDERHEIERIIPAGTITIPAE